MKVKKTKRSKIVHSSLCLLLTFIMVLSSFLTAFAEMPNKTIGISQQQEGGAGSSEKIEKYANYAIKLYQYITPEDRTVLRNAKQKVDSLLIEDELWNELWNDDVFKTLLTEEVKSRMNNDEGQAKSALRQLVSDALTIQFSPSNGNVDDLIDELKDFKEGNKETVEKLYNTNPDDIKITVDVLVDYFCDVAEKYVNPEYIKNSKYAPRLSAGTDEEIVDMIDEMILDIAEEVLDMYPELKEQMNQLGWNATLLHNCLNRLKVKIKEKDSDNLVQDSVLILFKAAIRTQADLYKVSVVDGEIFDVYAMDLTYAVGSDKIYGDTYYDLKVLGKRYNGSIKVVAQPEGVVTVTRDDLGDDELIKVTPNLGISDGQQCTLIFYRNPLDESYNGTGVPEKDWIIKLDVEIDRDDVSSYNVSVDKEVVEPDEGITITVQGPVGDLVRIVIKDENGATKYDSTGTISQDGIFTKPIIIGSTWATGNYTIYVGKGTDISSTIFRVKEKASGVTGVELDKETLALVVGEEATLEATVLPETASNKNVIWSSSNADVATVDANGKVTAVGAGTATITVTTEDGGYTDTCTVTVTIPVTGVELDKEAIALKVGEEATLEATVLPETASNKNVTWSSDNEAVATVDANGKVTAVDEGTAIITVTTEDGGYTATCIVLVTKDSKTYVVGVDKSVVEQGEEITITGTGPAEESIRVIVKDKNNATKYDSTVKTNENNIFVLKLTIGATWVIGNYTVYVGQGTNTATATFQVKEKTIVSVTGVELDEEAIDLKVGEEATLKATVLPSNASNKNVTWSSSNEAVATVDANGKVTAVGAGTAIITVTTVDGGYTDTCIVTVIEDSATYTVSVNKKVVEQGGEITITGTGPAGARIRIIIKDKNNGTKYDSTTNINGNGTFSLTITIGSTWVMGDYTVYVGRGTNTVTTIFCVGIPVTGVELDKEMLTLAEGEEATLEATVSPSNASNKNVTWSSSNESVAKVDASGKITAVGVGTAIITVTTEDGGYTDTCTVTVVTVPVTGVELNKEAIELTIGGTETLVATVLPSNASNKNVTWSSSNGAVATVDANGKVTAVGVGTAIITVKTVDGGFEDTCTVKVLSSEKQIISFRISGQIGATLIDEDTHTIRVVVPRGTDRTQLAPAIRVSEGATVSPASDEPQDFTNEVSYTVTAEDGETQTFRVIVIEPILIDEKETAINNENPAYEIPDTGTSEESIVINIAEGTKNPIVVVSTPKDSSLTTQQVDINVEPNVVAPIIHMSNRTPSGTDEVEAYLPFEFNIRMNIGDLGTVEVTIPKGTKVMTDNEWDGIIDLPEMIKSAERKQTVKQEIEKHPENKNKAEVKEWDIIQIGSSAVEMQFDKPIRLLFKNKALNKNVKVGYTDNKGNFIPITYQLSSDTPEEVAEELKKDNKREGWLIKGNDVIIWTTHFTEYVVYVENEAPIAEDVDISGTLRVGKTLTGSYRYVDAEGDKEGETELNWYRASNRNGTGKKLVATGTNEYELTSADKDMYIFFEVIPKAETGTQIGEAKVAISGLVLAQSGGSSGTSGKGSGTIIVTPPQVSLPKDVVGHWAQDYIKLLIEKQAISGYPDGTFRPDANITRAEFATILVKALNLQTRTGKVFADTLNHWAKDIISTAQAHGIINGYDAQTFGPDDYITREQMAVMIARAAGLYNAAAGKYFADSSEFSEWAVNAIAAISEKGIINGYPDGTFRPKNLATRAEAVTVITKILKN